MTTKIFYDSEFTGLHQHTTLISIGLVSECGLQFYAEFTDYQQQQCDDWINAHVIAYTQWLKNNNNTHAQHSQQGQLTQCVGDTAYIVQHLKPWLAQFQRIEIWADCLAYDWVLFCQLFGGALNVPKQIFYMPNDLVTLFWQKGINPDCNRIEFSGQAQLQRHNALSDALIARACYHKLTAS